MENQDTLRGNSEGLSINVEVEEPSSSGSDRPPDSLVKKNVDSSSTSINIPSTSTCQPSGEKDSSLNNQGQSSKISEETNPNPKLPDEGNADKPQSRPHADSEETNKVKSETNHDKDNSPVPKDCNHQQSVSENSSSANPTTSITPQSPTVKYSDFLTSDDVNQLKTLSENSKDKTLIEKLTDLSKWLKTKKAAINLSNVSEVLKSSMNFFNLTLRYQRLPEDLKNNQKILLFCSQGNAEALLCTFRHKRNDNAEHKVCLQTFEKLCRPNIEIRSEPGRPDLLITSNFVIDEDGMSPRFSLGKRKRNDFNMNQGNMNLPQRGWTQEQHNRYPPANNNYYQSDNSPISKNLNQQQSVSDNSSSANPATSINPQSPTVKYSQFLTSNDVNQLKTLSENSKDKGLIEKLTDLSKWLKNKKAKINLFNASEFLKSAMNFFNLNLTFQRLPQPMRNVQKILLFCCLGPVEVLLSVFTYKWNDNPEQKVCLKAFEKLCKQNLKIQHSEPGRPDFLVISDNLSGEGGKPPRYRSFGKRKRYDFSMTHGIIDLPQYDWIQQQYGYPPTKKHYQSDNFPTPRGFNHPQSASGNTSSFSSQNPSNSTTPGKLPAGVNLSPNVGSSASESVQVDCPTVESSEFFTSEDIIQLKKLSLNSKSNGLLAKLTDLSKWLKSKKSNINQSCISELLKNAMTFFNLNLHYKWLPGEKILLLCSLGTVEVLLCSTEYEKSENPEQKACLRAVDKLCQPYFSISYVPGGTDLLITSDFPLPGDERPIYIAAGLSNVGSEPGRTDLRRTSNFGRPGNDMPNHFSKGLPMSKSRMKREMWITNRTKRQQAAKAQKRRNRGAYQQSNPNAMLRYLKDNIEKRLQHYGAW